VIRIAIGYLIHETNSFSPLSTTLEDFRENIVHEGSEMLEYFAGTSTSIGGFIDFANLQGIKLLPTLAAKAVPSGMVDKEAYEHFKARILDGLESFGRVDGVLLELHGSMVAVGYPDAEGDLLHGIRRAVGENVPVMSVLDLHATLTRKMVENADAFFGLNTNPHIDYYERGVEAAEAIVATIRGEIHPVMSLRKPGILLPTINMRTVEGQPMFEVFRDVYELEKKVNVIDITVCGGFPFADVEDAGPGVLAITDGDQKLADSLAEQVSGRIWDLRDRFLWSGGIPPEQAVEEAMRADQGPIVLADIADNPGGGGSGDTTAILKTLIDKRAENVALATIWDPEAVAEAIKSGVGNKVTLALGGKTVEMGGKSVRVTGRVKTICDGEIINKGPLMTGLKLSFGRTVVIETDGIEIIINEHRQQPYDPQIFSRVGIDPRDKKILVIKSRGHFRAWIEPVAKRIIEVDAPGMASPNLRIFPYRNVRRPIFPLDTVADQSRHL
jgi:microcystin degradation protein MlrC